MANSQSDVSDALFNLATNPPVVPSRSDAKKARGQRQWMIALIRGAIEREGFQLVSSSNAAAFSEHGSVFEKTHNQKVGDIDVYVVLNGAGITDGQQQLQGRGEAHENPNTKLPTDAAQMAVWMFERTKEALVPYSANGKVEKSKRGARVTNVGRRNYDIIPSYRIVEADMEYHVIPDGNGAWTKNPTDAFLAKIRKLDQQNPRDPERKTIGFRDAVRLMKYWSKEQKWDETVGLTSFMIKCAAMSVYEMGARSKVNQEQLRRIAEKINGWIGQGYFLDPIENKQQCFKTRSPIKLPH